MKPDSLALATAMHDGSKSACCGSLTGSLATVGKAGPMGAVNPGSVTPSTPVTTGEMTENDGSD